jgi:glutathione S-transferase
MCLTEVEDMVALVILRNWLRTMRICLPTLLFCNHAESRAIARYISDKYDSQGTKLFGSSLKERALVNQWIEVESQNYNPAVSSIVFQIVFTPMFGLKRNEAVVDEQVAKLEKVLDVYEAHLSKSKYLAGDFFSLADLSHLPYTNLLVNATDKAEVITSRPHVHAWWKDISSRPSFTKVLGFQKQ